MSYLEHLDECNAEVEVCLITTYEAQAEENTNGHDGSQVHSTGHLDCLTAIKEGSGPGQDLGDQSRTGETNIRSGHCSRTHMKYNTYNARCQHVKLAAYSWLESSLFEKI